MDVWAVGASTLTESHWIVISLRRKPTCLRVGAVSIFVLMVTTCIWKQSETDQKVWRRAAEAKQLAARLEINYL